MEAFDNLKTLSNENIRNNRNQFIKNHKYLRSIQNYLLNKQTINLVGNS